MARTEVCNFLMLSLLIIFLQIDLSYTLINSTIDLSFTLRKNQTGHLLTRWKVSRGSSKLPDNMKIDVNIIATENGGIQYLNLQSLVTVPPEKAIDYELFPGIGFYKFYPEGESSFHLASSVCMKEGGHLAIVNSEAESKVMKMIYSRYTKAKDWAWIGFHDLDVEGKFVTIFGEPLNKMGFSRWYPGQPDNKDGDQNCGCIHRTGVLNDLYCEKHGPWPFFCEYDLSWWES